MIPTLENRLTCLRTGNWPRLTMASTWPAKWLVAPDSGKPQNDRQVAGQTESRQVLTWVIPTTVRPVSVRSKWAGLGAQGARSAPQPLSNVCQFLASSLVVVFWEGFFCSQLEFSLPAVVFRVSCYKAKCILRILWNDRRHRPT